MLYLLAMRKVLPITLLIAALAVVGAESGVFSVLKTTVLLGKQSDGLFLVSTNQLIHPWGEQTVIPGRPVDMTWDSARRFLAVLNTRTLVLLDGSTGAKLADIETRATSYAGIAFRPRDRQLWASETARNGPDGIAIAEISETGWPSK